MNKLYGIMRIEKRRRSAVFGLQKEANRTKEDHEQGREFDHSDIDWDKTDQNIWMIKSEHWNKAITDLIHSTGAKERKDSVVMLDALYTISPEWFDFHSEKEAMEFFQDALDFHVQEYCGGNKDLVINAVIHKDEKSWHMQVASVPLIEDEKGFHLNAKKVMGNRDVYRMHQDRFHDQVCKNRGLDRGELKDSLNKKIHKTKRQWELEEIDRKQTDLERRQRTDAAEEIRQHTQDALQDLGSIKARKGFFNKNKVIMDQKSLDSLKAAATGTEALNRAADELMRQIDAAAKNDRVDQIKEAFKRSHKEHLQLIEDLEQQLALTRQDLQRERGDKLLLLDLIDSLGLTRKIEQEIKRRAQQRSIEYDEEYEYER